MNLFDSYIKQIEDYIATNGAGICKLSTNAESIKAAAGNTFLMERDTAIELGGYPKESINLILPASISSLATSTYEDGIYCIGDCNNIKTGHCSFGKIVILWVDDIPEEEMYDFMQAKLMTDIGIHMEDIMLRQSPNHYQINLRVGKKAFDSGFSMEGMGRTIYDAFAKMEHVKAVTLILIIGDNPIYKQLFPVAEKVKELSLALNHIFDGIDMNCSSCEQSVICDEIKEVRELHRRLI